MAQHEVTQAAGAVLWRADSDTSGIEPEPEILLIHRPRYDDWSLPKGKLDTGEHVVAAAVREVAEETGYLVRLGRPLPAQHYHVLGRPKQVRYWAATPLGGGDGAFEPNREVDRLEWLPLTAARHRVSYERDVAVLASFAEHRHDTVPLILLRHATAVPRAEWTAPDADRPLADRARAEVATLLSLLLAYRPTTVLSSPARRCLDTVRPYAERERYRVDVEPALTEPAFATSPSVALGRVAALLTKGEPAVVCTHRPVFPLLAADLFTGAGVHPDVVPPAPELELGACWVLHLSRGRLLAVEHHTV